MGSLSLFTRQRALKKGYFCWLRAKKPNHLHTDLNLGYPKDTKFCLESKASFIDISVVLIHLSCFWLLGFGDIALFLDSSVVSLKSLPWPKYTKLGTIFQKKIVFHYQTFFLLQICSLLATLVYLQVYCAGGLPLVPPLWVPLQALLATCTCLSVAPVCVPSNPKLFVSFPALLVAALFIFGAPDCISNPMLATLLQFTDLFLPSTMLYLSLVIAYMAKEIGKERKCAEDVQEDSPLNQFLIHC